MQISENDWIKYKNKLASISDKAADEMVQWLQRKGGYQNISKEELIDYAYALSTKYGEASASLSALMYDEVAEKSGVVIPSAEVAETATYSEVAKAVNGVTKKLTTDKQVGSVVGRTVKQAGADTTLKNAERDGAQFAWVPSGDTCVFCMMLASNGWQYMSKKAMKNGHAEHIHANCDCTYAVSFDGKTTIKGYDPDKYKEIFENAEGDTWNEKINSVRRAQYQMNKDKINAQKRIVYASKSGKSNETSTFTFTKPNDAIINFENNSRNLKNERAIITKPDGTVWDESKGKGNRVVIDQPPEAGYFFSHNHPVDTTFSVADINSFEKSGYKQIRAASPKYNYIMEALEPVQKTNPDDRLFTDAMIDKWDQLDKESSEKRKEINATAMQISDKTERRKYVSEEYNKLVIWKEEEQNKWLESEAPNYGYRYTYEKVK